MYLFEQKTKKEIVAALENFVSVDATLKPFYAQAKFVFREFNLILVI